MDVSLEKRPKVYYKKCAFQECVNNVAVNPNVTYHLFPRNEALCRSWLEAINNPLCSNLSYLQLRNSYSVCSEHFDSSQFQSAEKKKLLRGVVPKRYSVEISHAEPHASTTSAISPTPSEQLPSLIEEEPVPSTSDYRNVSETGSPRHVRSQLLRSVGVTETKHLTPRKRVLFKTIKSERKVAAYYKTKLRKCSRDLFGVKKFLKNGDILTNTALRFFEDISPAAQTFFASQLKHKGKSRRQFRWDAKEKSFFLALYKTSPKGYRFLQKIFNLPSARTLQRTLNSLNINAGINNAIFNHMAKISSGMKLMKQYCCLVFDEVALLPHLDFNAQFKNIVGLEDFGTYKTKNVADHALVFMLKGINAFWKQPVAYFFAKSGTKTYQLKSLIKEIISEVHTRTSFKILATVSDQGSANVAAIASLAHDSGYPNDFVFVVNGHKIHHIFDPPHLIKGMRNNLLTKNIIFDGKVAKWSDIIDLYKFDGLANPDGKLCVKLSEAHVFPKGKDKMKVKLATQVFSRSVYAALTFASNTKVMDTHGTAEFIIFMNKLFDSLNGVRNSSKPLNGPLTDQSNHFEFWAQAKHLLRDVKFMVGDRCVPTPPTVKHLIVTLRNMQSLWTVLKHHEFKFLLTRSVNQDCLENTFGIIRGLCGQNSRPTVHQFRAAFKTCLINNLVANTNNTNCEDDGTHFVVGLLDTFAEQENVQSGMDHAAISVEGDVPQLAAHAGIVVEQQIVVSKLLRTNTSSYISGFICKNILNKDCHFCKTYFSTATVTDSHSFIALKDYSGTRLYYPSEELIQIVNLRKRIIFETFFDWLHLDNLFIKLSELIAVDLSCCEVHDVVNNVNITNSIVHIMIKYILYQINRKLGRKDFRPNNVIDLYVKVHCPKVFK